MLQPTSLHFPADMNITYMTDNVFWVDTALCKKTKINGEADP